MLIPGEMSSGVEQALLQMRKGDIVLVEVPPQLGHKGRPLNSNIPPYVTVAYEIRMMDVIRSPEDIWENKEEGEEWFVLSDHFVVES